MIGKSISKKAARLRRAKKTRDLICESGSHRLSVYKSINHIYVQVLTPNGDKVITTISTNQKNTKTKSNNIENSKIIGKLVAEFIKKEKITKIAFDRSGYKYHGKIRAIAESIRENGVKI